MAQFRRVINLTTNQEILPRGRWCASSWCRFKGLMFRPSLPPDEGLIFVRKGMSIVNTSIHMLFCFFPIAVIWLDSQLVVVDAKLAKPWRLSYVPQKPAQYFIEANVDLLERVSIGDQLAFE
ncbi:MAG: hypothetical protein CUN55_01970 [Phototrophicales bacterium]|nr:MAG: hypothetical protein CUN55_01970 [Phototrophicales bacterium]